MVNLIGQALYYFLPSYAGNAAPVILNRLGWFDSLRKPIDGGRKWGENYIFGSTKTWRGLLGGAAAGTIIAGFQVILYVFVPDIRGWYLIPYDSLSLLILGFLLGLGEGLGDLFKSFIKRRLGIRSSGPFFPFDQMSFLGALLFASLYYIPSLDYLIVIVIFSLIIPVFSNIIAYKLRWKEVWY